MSALIVRLTCGAVLLALGEPRSGPAVPLVPGLKLVSALRTPQGDRENVVVVGNVSSEGVDYTWRFTQRRTDGKTFDGHFTRFVRANDMAGAPRLNTVFMSENEETPGYTAMSISRSAYNRIRAEHEIRFAITTLRTSALGPAFEALGSDVNGLVSPRVTLRGSLTLMSPDVEPMPMLLDGKRVSLPTLHLKGQFGETADRQPSDFWVLADSTNPLILRVVSPQNVFQMVRIDLPSELSIESALERECRAELPGIYFAFASADLESTSNAALDGVATVMTRHPDWTLAIEGHTDSVGTAKANQQLSVARAEAVRKALIDERRVAPTRLTAAGYGAARPREPNTTLEGRARNRRVELVRNCAG